MRYTVQYPMYGAPTVPQFVRHTSDIDLYAPCASGTAARNASSSISYGSTFGALSVIVVLNIIAITAKTPKKSAIATVYECFDDFRFAFGGYWKTHNVSYYDDL